MLWPRSCAPNNALVAWKAHSGMPVTLPYATENGGNSLHCPPRSLPRRTSTSLQTSWYNLCSHLHVSHCRERFLSSHTPAPCVWQSTRTYGKWCTGKVISLELSPKWKIPPRFGWSPVQNEAQVQGICIVVCLTWETRCFLLKTLVTSNELLGSCPSHWKQSSTNFTCTRTTLLTLLCWKCRCYLFIYLFTGGEETDKHHHTGMMRITTC